MAKIELTNEKKDEFRDSLINQNVLIVWKPEYDLRIPIVDEHHRGIVSTINSLYVGMQHKHGKELLRPVSTMVYEYTLIHFQVEEDFQIKYGFPGHAHHHELHSDLTQKLSQISNKSNWDQDPYEFLEFLKDWWINHIRHEDRLFTDYLLQQSP
jgi:hemerythrin-like metal-binding protein